MKQQEHGFHWLRWIQSMSILLAVFLIGLGAWRGEAELVLKKAIYICMECIGIG